MLPEEELMKAIVESSPVGYIVCDDLGEVTYINEKIGELTGWRFKEVISKDVKEICSFPESLKEGAGNRLQAAIVYKKDGSKITMKSEIIELKTLLRKEKFLGYVIKLYPDSKVTESVNKAQMEFISTVSHELRTPLTSIRGFSETLLRSWEKLETEIKKRYVTIIKEQSERLTRLVEDLLAVSRLESDIYKLTVRSVNLQSVIDKVCESLSSKAAKHKLVVDIESALPNLRADPDRLEQILTNLIDNAIKYSQVGSAVTISAVALTNDQKIKEKVKIDVTDQGVGINKEDLPKIFTKFGRVDNPLTRQTQGTGLGLFITKSLVLGLKGEIFVKSKKGETTFTVVLPAEISTEAIQLSTSFEQSQKDK